MSGELLRAAVKLDDETRRRVMGAFVGSRDSAAERGDAALAEVLNEMMIVLHDAGTLAERERLELDVAFHAVLGFVPSGSCNFGGES